MRSQLPGSEFKMFHLAPYSTVLRQKDLISLIAGKCTRGVCYAKLPIRLDIGQISQPVSSFTNGRTFSSDQPPTSSGRAASCDLIPWKRSLIGEYQFRDGF